MRRYSRDDEARVRTIDRVREWVRSGLLDAAQGEALIAGLAVDLRQTNPFLRAGLALFTALIVAASVGLVAVFLDLRASFAIGVVTAVATLACVAATEVLAGTYRLYRFGVEEALAVAAVVLLCLTVKEWWPATGLATALSVAACGGFALYLRYGFVYAAVAAAICVAAIPFQVALSPAVQHSAAAVFAAMMFLITRAARLKFGDDYPGDEYGDLQAVSLAGIYVAFNLHLAAPPVHTIDGFYWFTYLMIWILPAAGLYLGLRDRDRSLIDLGVLLALATLVTTKPYFGWARNTWDPIVFGACLIAGAALLRRWLQHGPGGERHGFTAARVFDKDQRARSMLGTISVALPLPTPPASVPPTAFGGGRSGGGGAGGSF
jgi:hypothetical protein